MASAVLGTQSSAQDLWQVAQIDVQTGIEALEEALKSGLLCAEQAKIGRQSTYLFVHGLIRDVVYTGIGEARRQDLHQQAFAVLQRKGARASELALTLVQFDQFLDGPGILQEGSRFVDSSLLHIHL